MITSNYFNNYEAANEQVLLEDLIIESIKIYGINCVYVARTLGSDYNRLYESDTQSTYEQNWMIEVFLKNVFGFAGDREFMSKFAALEIRDQLIFTMSVRRFVDEIGRELNTTRPREGDLLFFPFPHAQKVFQIKYVNQTETFYQLGSIYTWELTCELFEYSHEVFKTGIPELDDIQAHLSLDILNYTIKDTDGLPLYFNENGDYWVTDGYSIEAVEPTADNTEVQTKQTVWVDWTVTDPFSEAGGTEKQI